jgi:hypothetical protein
MYNEYLRCSKKQGVTNPKCQTFYNYSKQICPSDTVRRTHAQPTASEACTNARSKCRQAGRISFLVPATNLNLLNAGSKAIRWVPWQSGATWIRDALFSTTEAVLLAGLFVHGREHARPSRGNSSVNGRVFPCFLERVCSNYAAACGR